MKVVLSLLSLVACVGATTIKADSKIGQEMISAATRGLENNQYQNTWVQGYSLKFQGCHHISQWNSDVEDEDDVRIATKRLVRFRMCPTDSCDGDNTRGCTEGYGDYILDLNTYLSYYFAAKSEYQQFQCQSLAQNVCNCNNNNGNGNGNNKQYCLYDCFEDHNMETVCMNYNPYNGNGNENANNNANGENAEGGFSLENYMYCSDSGLYDANGNSLYIGPYCAGQGGAVYLGVFTDEDCTNFADEDGGASTYAYATGSSLPYADTNVIDLDCVSCQEPNNYNYDGNDANDADDVAEVCEAIYTLAGKCEANLPYGTASYPNNNACNYMEGIKIVRKDGTVVTADAKANKTASIFIGIFVVAFVLLSAYVYYLKTKLDRASINLAE